MNTRISMVAVSRAQAATLLATSLIGPRPTDRLTLDCALLRSCLWAETRGASPVHINRLLNMSVSISAPLIASDADVARRAELRDALDELAEAGDVAELAGGRWVAAPVREIRLLGDVDERLVVGGVPTALIPAPARDEIDHEGPFRRVRGPGLADALGLDAQSLDSWLGGHMSDLRTWGAGVLAMTLQPYDGSTEEGRFVIYAPRRGAIFKPYTPQGFRWTDELGLLSGRYLALRELPFGPREPRIVEIAAGRVVATAVPSFGDGDLRRLQYAVDSNSASPTDARVARSSERLEVTLKSEVPRRERRLFAALGRLHPGAERYYPRNWSFPLQHEATVLDALRGLGITVKT